MKLTIKGCVNVKEIYNHTGIVNPEKFEDVFGGYNDYPPNWKQVTEKEFSHSMFFFYEPTIRDHRQMMTDSRSSMLDATLYFFHDGSGVAMSADHKNEEVNYYTFGVNEHDFEERNIGRCLTEKKCKRCGYVEEVDSSD